MGATESTAAFDVLNEVAINAVQRSVQECTTIANQDQIFEVAHVGGNVNISGSTFQQSSSVDVSCVMDSSKELDIKSAISNDLVQKVESEVKGLLVPPGGNMSEVITEICNQLEFNLTQEDIQDSFVEVAQQQRISYGFVGGDFVAKNLTINQTLDLISNTFVSTESVQKVIGDIINTGRQEAATKSTGLAAGAIEDVTGMLGSWGTAVIGVVAMIFIIILAVVAMLLFGNGGEKKQDAIRQMMMYRAMKSR
jgi:hypothetical protein